MVFLLKSPKKLKTISLTKKQSNDYGLIATSYHESSHTIIALINLLMVNNVNVLGSQEGNTLYFLHHADNAEDDKLKNVIVLSELRTIYAGLVGEKIYYKDACGNNNFPMHLKIGSAFDTTTASKLICKYKMADSGKSTFNFKKNIKEDVEKTLTEHWDAVKLVAHTLYKKKKLSFSELKYLLTRTSNNRDFWKEKFKSIKVIYDEKNDLSTKIVRNLILTKE